MVASVVVIVFGRVVRCVTVVRDVTVVVCVVDVITTTSWQKARMKMGVTAHPGVVLSDSTRTHSLLVTTAPTLVTCALVGRYVGGPHDDPTNTRTAALPPGITSPDAMHATRADAPTLEPLRQLCGDPTAPNVPNTNESLSSDSGGPVAALHPSGVAHVAS